MSIILLIYNKECNLCGNSINSVGVGLIMECRKCFGNARCL